MLARWLCRARPEVELGIIARLEHVRGPDAHRLAAKKDEQAAHVDRAQVVTGGGRRAHLDARAGLGRVPAQVVTGQAYCFPLSWPK